MTVLEEDWEEVKDAIGQFSFRVFPSHLEIEGIPVAHWPDASKPQEFLALAQESGVSLLYITEDTFDEGHLPVIEDDHEGRDGLDILYEVGRDHLGDLIFVAVWWVHGGVVHEWSADADWFLDYQESLEVVLESIEEEADVRRDRDVNKQAKEIATDPAFQKARTPDQREYIARKLFPELGSADQDGFDWTFGRLAREAQAIYEVDILPMQEQGVADKARGLMNEGRPRSKTAEELGISDDKLKRILQTHPAA
ncbi:MAG: hypothetical protein GEU71_02000 [Actinobacteria bacterium]|nr:hypothetical protein [Actinomycetota bacterium]